MEEGRRLRFRIPRGKNFKDLSVPVRDNFGCFRVPVGTTSAHSCVGVTYWGEAYTENCNVGKNAMCTGGMAGPESRSKGLFHLAFI